MKVYPHKTIHSSFIHNSPQVETTVMCINGNNWQTAAQSYPEVPLSKEEQMIHQPRRENAQVLCGVREARPKSLFCIVYSCICQKFKNS